VGVQKKKYWKSCPENWKIRKKLKVLFPMGTAGTISDFFLNVHNNPYELLCKEKLEKLSGKLENSGKTESAFL
jgi:hypothetical protein